MGKKRHNVVFSFHSLREQVQCSILYVLSKRGGQSLCYLCTICKRSHRDLLERKRKNRAAIRKSLHSIVLYVHAIGIRGGGAMLCYICIGLQFKREAMRLCDRFHNIAIQGRVTILHFVDVQPSLHRCSVACVLRIHTRTALEFDLTEASTQKMHIMFRYIPHAGED